MDYTALKTELQTDPKSFGYKAFLDAGDYQRVADLLNKSDWAPTDPHFETQPRPSVLGGAAATFVDAAEFAALPSGLQNYLIFVAAASGGSEIPFFDPTDPTGQTHTPFYNWLVTQFPANTKTGAKIYALQLKPVTRAGALGLDLVRIEDVAQAIRGHA